MCRAEKSVPYAGMDEEVAFAVRRSFADGSRFIMAIAMAIAYEKARPWIIPTFLPRQARKCWEVRPRIAKGHEAFREALAMAPNRLRSIEGLSASR